MGFMKMCLGLKKPWRRAFLIEVSVFDILCILQFHLYEKLSHLYRGLGWGEGEGFLEGFRCTP